MQPLTRQQARVLGAIEELIATQGYPPSMREIGRRLSISPGTVHFHVHSLAARGRLRHDGRGHGISVLKAPAASPSLPLRGDLVAGLPLELAEGDVPGVEVTAALAEEGSFALRVRGDGDREAGILEGDLLVVRRQESVGEGELAVALLPDGSCTVRRPFRDGAGFRLEAPAAGARPGEAATLQIVGRVLGLVRSYRA